MELKDILSKCDHRGRWFESISAHHRLPVRAAHKSFMRDLEGYTE